VLHVIASTRRRGAEVFAADLIRTLQGLGADQRVAVIRDRGDEGVNFVAPVDVLTSGHRVFRQRVASLRSAASLRRITLRWRPDVVQAHGGEAFTASALARLTRPLVYRRIGCAPSSLTGGWRRFTTERVTDRAAMVVAVADAVRRETLELFGIEPDRIVTIPNAVDVDRLAVASDRATTRDGLGMDRDALVVLSLGALAWEKDPLAHLRVAARVLAEVPNAIHVFAGDGPLRRRVECEASALGVADRVRFLGVRRDVPDLLRAADAVLFASRPDGMEGMPAVLIEAGILGVPVAAYDVAGVSEVVADGETGFLVRWGDERGLGGTLVRLLHDPALRASMGQAARRRCLACFDIRAIAPRYAEVYERVTRRT
jgi:glycosyltransferase involved in cell wall biosynthesis